MSTKIDLLKAYLKHNNLTYVSGECWDPLLPFLILDCVYQIYNDTIKKLNLEHEMKRQANIWSENYGKINKAFFRSFNDDQQDEIIDMMDDFQKWIKEDLDNVMNKFMDNVPVDDIDLRKIVSSCLLVSALVKAAKYIFRNRFKNMKLAYGNPLEYLSKIERSAIIISRYYYISSENYNTNNDESLMESIGSLCNRMVSFLKQ